MARTLIKIMRVGDQSHGKEKFLDIVQGQRGRTRRCADRARETLLTHNLTDLVHEIFLLTLSLINFLRKLNLK